MDIRVGTNHIDSLRTSSGFMVTHMWSLAGMLLTPSKLTSSTPPMSMFRRCLRPTASRWKCSPSPTVLDTACNVDGLARESLRVSLVRLKQPTRAMQFVRGLGRRQLSPGEKHGLVPPSPQLTFHRWNAALGRWLHTLIWPRTPH